METYNSSSPEQQMPHSPGGQRRSGRVIGGLLIVAIGLILLARQAGVDFPGWLISFETILIALGIYLGMRHSFRGFLWLIPILIGGFLLIDDFFPQYDIEDFTWPLIIIGFGLFIMFRAERKNRDWKKWEAGQPGQETAAEDYLDSTVIFGGVKKNVISKNFRGGETVTVFGGSEINLTQADINGPVVLELTQVFGGTKLIVPAHWKIQSKDMVAIFGGIDDKRPPVGSASADEPEKILVLQGTCLMGGIDIRSY